MIHICTCGHEYQDRLYGKGKRVYNIGKTNKICTVCGNKVSLTESEIKASKTKDIDIKK